jgi:hypothetical protein
MFFRTLLAHVRGYPFATNLSLVSIPIGLLALGIGPDISRGFTVVFGNFAEIIYVWGAVLLLGGGNVAIGIGRRLPSRERAGLYVLAAAYAFYGACVILGLGWGGMVTGPAFLCLALSCALRADVIRVTAKALVALADD